ncbi:hypothetical protein GCM10009104_03180 [Marinobacterium maritimum]|uniref:Uncharacterized protein n=1 Tax=Marinobacterium maritimum TaxID=500162 RepID=A0ABP3T7V3_9GAMM
MQRLVILLTVIVSALAIYLFIVPEQTTLDPSSPTPVSESTRLEAREHIKSLTQQAAEDTLDVAAANHFVTGSQLLQLPETKQETEQAIALNPTDSDSATSFAVDLPTPTNTDSGLEAQSPILTPQDRLRLQELLNNPNQAADEIFYVHSVRNSDQQGLWGIIHQGLIETFTRGIRIEDRSRLLSAHIPADADEPLTDQRSSWLGHLLKRKVEETWVFNYQQGLLGRNPNVIHPGQQLVIVRFSEDELIDIYNHFTHSGAN